MLLKAHSQPLSENLNSQDKWSVWIKRISTSETRLSPRKESWTCPDLSLMASSPICKIWKKCGTTASSTKFRWLLKTALSYFQRPRETPKRIEKTLFKLCSKSSMSQASTWLFSKYWPFLLLEKRLEWFSTQDIHWHQRFLSTKVLLYHMRFRRWIWLANIWLITLWTWWKKMELTSQTVENRQLEPMPRILKKRFVMWQVILKEVSRNLVKILINQQFTNFLMEMR